MNTPPPPDLAPSSHPDVALIRTGPDAVLYDTTRIHDAGLHLFDPSQWRTGAATGGSTEGRGRAHFFSHEGRSLVLRHYQRGGYIGRLVRDRYWWQGEDASRPFREWWLTRELHQAGLPVPAAVACHYRREGLLYRGDLITEEILASKSVDASLQQQGLARDTWWNIGVSVGRLHAYGACHADLNPRNILVDAQGIATVIDFDRGRIRSPGQWRRRNLQRLRTSTRTIVQGLPENRFTDEDWQVLLDGYRSILAL